MILPGAAYTEKTGIYVNTEGRPQFAERAVFPPGDAREDWAILRALSDALGAQAAFRLADRNCAPRSPPPIPHLVALDEIAPADAAALASLASLGGAVDKAPFGAPVADFYLTNPIARASRVMAECSALAQGRKLKRRNRTDMSSAHSTRPAASSWLAVAGDRRAGRAIVIVALLWFLIAGGYSPPSATGCTRPTSGPSFATSSRAWCCWSACCCRPPS